MKRFLQFPELLLLVVLLFIGARFLSLSFAIAISWVFHVVLRSKYPANYPAFGSWAHVFLTTVCCILLMLALYQADTRQETGQSEIGGIINHFFGMLNALMWMDATALLAMLLLGLQVVFWLAAVHSLRKRGKNRRPSAK